jgi:hypothetical protein
VIFSANIHGVVFEDRFEKIKELPGKNDIDPALDGRQEWDTEIDCNHLPGDSTSETPLGRILLTERMKGMTRYQLMIFMHELFLFFISSFFFSLHI